MESETIMTHSSPKTLLVLGASLYQLGAINAAISAGYRVVTLDYLPDNPGHQLADRFHIVSTTDREAVEQVARAEQIDGAVAVATDVAVPTVAHLAEVLGIPGPPLASAEIVCHKSAFRRFLEEEGLPCPQALSIGPDEDDVPSVLSGESPGQWIIKPDASSGSKGTRMIASAAEYVAALPEARSFSLNGKVVLEQFILGHQGTLEGVLLDGELVFSLLLDRQTVAPPFVVTAGHQVPTCLSEASQGRVLSRVQDVMARLGIHTGPFDCDFVVAEDGEVYLLEISPRVGGNAISDLLKTACSFDIVDVAVRLACGERPSLPDHFGIQPTAIVLLGTDQAGELQYEATEVPAIQALSWVRALSLDREPGERVEPFVNGRNRVGMALLVASTREELCERVEWVRERLNVRAKA
jgi:biotin carboxylase